MEMCECGKVIYQTMGEKIYLYLYYTYGNLRNLHSHTHTSEKYRVNCCFYCIKNVRVGISYPHTLSHHPHTNASSIGPAPGAGSVWTFKGVPAGFVTSAPVRSALVGPRLLPGVQGLLLLRCTDIVPQLSQNSWKCHQGALGDLAVFMGVNAHLLFRDSPQFF